MLATGPGQGSGERAHVVGSRRRGTVQLCLNPAYRRRRRLAKHLIGETEQGRADCAHNKRHHCAGIPVFILQK